MFAKHIAITAKKKEMRSLTSFIYIVNVFKIGVKIIDRNSCKCKKPAGYVWVGFFTLGFLLLPMSYPISLRYFKVNL